MKRVELQEASTFASGAAGIRAKNVKLRDLEFQRTKLKRRMLGNIRFIGELFLKQACLSTNYERRRCFCAALLSPHPI